MKMEPQIKQEPLDSDEPVSDDGVGDYFEIEPTTALLVKAEVKCEPDAEDEESGLKLPQELSQEHYSRQNDFASERCA